MNKYIFATMVGLATIGMGAANYVGAQAVPTILSLPAAPTRVQIQSLAVNALVSAAQANGTLAQMQNAAAQQLLGNLNTPNALNPNGGTVTLAQAFAVVTQDPAAGNAVLATVPPQAKLLLAQNAVAALQQALAQQAASQAATVAANLANPPVAAPAPAPTPAQPTGVQTPVPTILSLPARPTPVQIQGIAAQALITGAQAGGTLAQVQNAAAQVVLAALNAPNAVNLTGGSSTLAQALALVTSPIVASKANVTGVTVFVALPPQPGIPGVVTVPVFQPFPPQVTILLAQNALVALQQTLVQQATSTSAQPVPAQPVIAPLVTSPTVTAPAAQAVGTTTVATQPPVTQPVVNPAPITPAKNNGNGQGSGKALAQTVVTPPVNQPAMNPAPVTPAQNGNQGSGKGNGQSVQTAVQTPATPPVLTPAQPAAASMPVAPAQNSGKSNSNGQGSGK